MSASTSAPAGSSQTPGGAPPGPAAQAESNQHPSGASMASDQPGPTTHTEGEHMDIDTDNPLPDKGKAKENARPDTTERREDVWQDRVNNAIPHRDLRMNSGNLPRPGLGNMLNASMRIRPPVKPLFEEEEDEEEEEENAKPPLSSWKAKLPMKYEKEDGLSDLGSDFPGDDKNFITREEVLEICDSIREDMNSGFNRVIDRMDERRKSVPKVRTPPTPRKSKSGKRISTLSIRRDPSKIETAKMVRDHLTTLIGKDMLLIPQVTAEESATFEARWSGSKGNSCSPCCTSENFRVDILGTPRNPWNTSATRVFYHSLVPEAKRSTSSLKDITEAFYTRLKSLKQDYKTKRGEAQRRTKKRDDRRRARKHYLFQRRLGVASTVPALTHHCTILEELTAAGMSSDESDSERLVHDPKLRNERPKYEVTMPAWRNPRLHNWLRVFDVLHIADRRTNAALVGEWPHNRFRHSFAPKPSSSTGFVSRLPRNAYNEAWLAMRHDIEFVVQPLDQEYDFTHGDAVYLYLGGDSSANRAGTSGRG